MRRAHTQGWGAPEPALLQQATQAVALLRKDVGELGSGKLPASPGGLLEHTIMWVPLIAGSVIMQHHAEGLMLPAAMVGVMMGVPVTTAACANRIPASLPLLPCLPASPSPLLTHRRVAEIAIALAAAGQQQGALQQVISDATALLELIGDVDPDSASVQQQVKAMGKVRVLGAAGLDAAGAG